MFSPKTGPEKYRAKHDKAVGMFRSAAQLLRDANDEIELEKEEALAMAEHYRKEAAEYENIQRQNERVAGKLEEFLG